MAVRTRASQIVPVAGSITSSVQQGTTNVESNTNNTSLSGGNANVQSSTAATTVVFTGQARINRIHCTGTGGTLGNVTVYDNTSAAGRVLFGPQQIPAGTWEELQIECGIGITIVTAAATTLDVNYTSLV